MHDYLSRVSYLDFSSYLLSVNFLCSCVSIEASNTKAQTFKLAVHV